MTTFAATNTPITLDPITQGTKQLTFNITPAPGTVWHTAAGSPGKIHIDGVILDSNYDVKGVTQLPSVIQLSCVLGGSLSEGLALYRFPFGTFVNDPVSFPLAFSADITAFSGDFILNNGRCFTVAVFVSSEGPDVTNHWGQKLFTPPFTGFYTYHLRVDNIVFTVGSTTDGCPADSGGGPGTDGNICVGGCLTVASHTQTASGTTGNWSVTADAGVLATNAAPNGWTVTYSAGNLTICSPCGVAKGNVTIIYQVNSTAQAWVSIKLIDCSLCGAGGSHSGPSNHSDVQGKYHRVHIQDGDVFYNRWDYGTPAGTPPVKQIRVTITADAGDCAVKMHPNGQVYVVYSRTNGNAYRRLSTGDDGATWGMEQLAITGATRVTNAVGFDGRYVELGYIDAGGGTSGSLQLVYVDTGDDPHTSPPAHWTTPVTLQNDGGTNLTVKNQQFGLTHSKTPGGLWVLTVVIDGESASSDWWNTDLSMKKWKRY